MRILVTGGAGFIGSHLCDYLVKEGHKVVCIDNMSSGQQANIKHLLTKRNFKFIIRNVASPLKIGREVNQIYHLASRASPIDFQKYPVATALANSVGTYNMLKIAAQKKAPILFSSTSEVYGDPLTHPQKEDYWGNVNPIGPRSCYDESKRFGEALMMAYHRKHGIDTKIVRIFNTYGPRMRTNDGRAIPNFITQALRNKPITVYGRGLQTRSFCYVSDTVAGLLKVASSKLTGPINIGSPAEMKIRGLALLIKKLTESSSRIISKPLPKDDPIRRQPDISKAKKLLGWKPQISLENGLKKTIEFFRHKDNSSF